MKSLTHVLFLGVSCTAIVTGCGGTPDDAAKSSSESAATAGIERVSCGSPQRKQLIRTTNQPARIEAFEQTPLFAKLAGYIDTVSVDIGDVVKKDQPLVTLRIPELRDEVEQKKSLVNQATAEAKQAEANIAAVEAAGETAEAKVEEAKAGVARAKANAERWMAEYARIEELAGTGSVNDKLVDETRSQLRSAEAGQAEAIAAVQSAEATVRESEAMNAKAKADHTAAEARLGVAQADLARAETMLGYTVITAPYDGVITQRLIDTGHFVQPASGTAKPLLEIARTDKVRVFIEVPEMEAGLINNGDMVTLQIQAMPETALKAPIVRTSWSLDAGNRALRSEVDVENEGSLLRPGMFATANIELDRRENALTLPVEAVVRADGTTYCCRVESNKIVHQPIKLGLRAGSEIEVLEGLQDNSVVVLVRPQALKDGQAVQVLNKE
jgi:RND family efflux transporter MFP subunit